jgi:predicted SnoaL-like aldol condensation-catalyzing enzyme
MSTTPNDSTVAPRRGARSRQRSAVLSRALIVLICSVATLALAAGGVAVADLTSAGSRPAPSTRSITASGGTLSARETRNARTAIALTDLSENKHLVELAARRYIDARLIGHNAYAPDGRAGFIQLVGALVRANPDYTHFIGRVVTQGDYVVLHGLVKLNRGDRGTVAIDIFRFNAAGKVVEHWDALQPVVEHTNSGHPQICVLPSEPGCH